MGVVYRARQHEPSRDVALKTLRGADLPSLESRDRFRTEARAMAALEHPGILPVFAVGEEDGIPYFTMKLAGGGALSHRQAEFTEKWHEIADLVAGICDAVQFAHERGVLHRDLKPANILFDETGRAYVSDFGLAKLADATGNLTVTTGQLGTPLYLAPEIIESDARAATTLSDVWALGAMLYELLAQRPPFEAESHAVLLRRIVEKDPAPLPNAVPKDLRNIAGKALAKGPGRRYAGARELAEDLRRWRSGKPVMARSVSSAERVWLWARRSPALAILSLVTLLSLMAAVAGLAWSAAKVARERDAGREELRNSLLHQAIAKRIGRESGWRRESLEALRRAAQIRPGEDLRNAAIGCLSGMDISLTSSAPGRWTNAARDFSLCASYDLEGILHLWRADDGTRIGTFPKVRRFDAMYGVFSNNGRWIAGYGVSGDVHLYEVAGLRLVQSWPGMFFAGFTADDACFALYNSKTPARLLCTENLELAAELPPAALSAGRCTLAPSAVGHCVALVRGSGVELWDWRTQKAVRSLPLTEPPFTMALWGDWLAAGHRAGDVRLFNLRTGSARTLAGHNNLIASLVFEPCTGLLATGSYDGTSQLWHPDSGQQILVSREIYPRAFAPDGQRFLHVSAHEAGWGTLTRGASVRWLSHNHIGGGDSEVDISPDGRWLAYAAWPGVAVFDLPTGTLAAALTMNQTRAAHFTADGKGLIITGQTFAELHRLNLENRSLLVRREREFMPAGAAYLHTTHLSPDRRWLGFAVDHKRMGLLDCQDFSTWKWLPLPARPNMLVPGPGGFPASGSSFNNSDGIRVWETADGESQLLSKGNGIARFSPDGRYLADGGTERLRIYDAKTWQVVHEEGTGSSTDLPNRVAWSPDSRLLAFPKKRTLLCVLDTSAWRVTAELQSPIESPLSAIRFGPDGRTLAAARVTGSVEVWDLTRLAKELGDLGLPWELPSPTPIAAPVFTGEAKEAELPPLVPVK